MEDGVLEEEKPFTFTWPEAFVIGSGTAMLLLLLLFSPVAFSGSTSLEMGGKAVFVLFTCTVLLLVMMCSVKCMDLHASKNNCARLETEGVILRDTIALSLLDPADRSPAKEALEILKTYGPDSSKDLSEGATEGGYNPDLSKPPLGSSG